MGLSQPWINLSPRKHLVNLYSLLVILIIDDNHLILCQILIQSNFTGSIFEFMVTIGDASIS